MAEKEQLVDILKSLRVYIAKEYTIDPDSYKGEGGTKEGTGTDLPADWQDKLNPLSGGPGGEREVPGPHSTKEGTPKDAYLHKQNEGVMGQPVAKAEEDEVLEEEGMVDNEVVEPVEEVEAEGEGMEDMEKGFGDDSEVVSLLREIKMALEQAAFQKQSMAEIKSLQTTVAGLAKSIPESVQSRVDAGIKDGLKKFGGLSPSSAGDRPVRQNSPTSGQVRKEQTPIMHEAAPQPAVGLGSDAPDARIGVEGESLMKASDRIDDHASFVDGVEQIIGSSDPDDLRGTFRRVNRMREQSGESLTQNLYYWK